MIKVLQCALIGSAIGLVVPLGVRFLSHPVGVEPAPFVSTSTYLHLCDTALGEIKWIGGVPLCFIDLGKYRDKEASK